MCTWLIADSGNRSGDGGECKKLDWKWNRKKRAYCQVLLGDQSYNTKHSIKAR